METRSSMSRSLHINRDLEKLEPYEGKPSCTVLRGEEGSNALDLPDTPDNPSQSAKYPRPTWENATNNYENYIYLGHRRPALRFRRSCLVRG